MMIRREPVFAGSATYVYFSAHVDLAGDPDVAHLFRHATKTENNARIGAGAAAAAAAVAAAAGAIVILLLALLC